MADSAKKSDFNAIFHNAQIPHPVYGIDDIAVTYKPAEIEEIGRLADEMINDIAGNKPHRVYFDNDGTLFRFHPIPTKTRMDKDCFSGLVRLSQYPNFLATSLTGRDVNEAAAHMLTPGYQVTDSHGRVLNKEGDKTLRFSITGSHGVENIDTNHTVTRYDFAEDYGPEVNRFIQSFQQESAALRAKEKYKGIFVEDSKHAAVGINVRTIETTDAEVKALAYAEALEILQKFESSPLNPRHLATGKPVFQIKREGTEELELRPVGFGKDFGILKFGKPEKHVRTLFLGDSFKEPDGTDLDAAALINNKQYFDKGSVVMVRNGRVEPNLDGPSRPRVVFANPTMLGQFLCYVADKVENLKPLVKPAVYPALEPAALR